MTSATEELLAGEPGVYRVLDGPEEIMVALRATGWQPVVVASTASRTAFYAEIARALSFPDYFGANLDALWDSLTELEAPTAVVLLGWTTLALARPDGWRRILEVLSERTRSSPPFAVVLA